MMLTLALDNTWDLYVDEFGDIAVKEGNDQIAQDVASSCRVFKGECRFDTARGIEYNKPDEIRDTLRFDLRREAQRIDGVKEAQVVIDSKKDRTANLEIFITTEDGETIDVR